jgi:signal transduction histidine kinase
VANLLDNAIRHAPPGGVIDLRAEAGAGGVDLYVADPGSGIPEEQRAKLFKRFQRGDHSDPKGSGLGLAIVAEIAHLHGGGVEARNRPQGGAEFVLRLPPQSATPLVTKS